MNGRHTAAAAILLAMAAGMSSCDRLDLFSLSLAPPLAEGRSWTGFTMVFDVGPPGSSYDWILSSPCVIRDGELYRMWFGARGTGDGIFRVHYSESTDGLAWSAGEIAIPGGTRGTLQVTSSGRPTVIKDGSVYRMWYSGTVGSASRIVYAESVDARAWTGDQIAIETGSLAPYDTTSVQGPTVIRDGELYRMWYVAVDDGGTYRILYAQSSDALQWTGHRVALQAGAQGSYDAQAIGQPAVLKDNTVYKVWYDGTDTSGIRRIIYAESADAVTWGAFQMVVDIGQEGTYDLTDVSSPTVVSTGGVARMWYGGFDGGSSWRFLYAHSP